MMKKLLLLSSAVFAFHFGAMAQIPSTPSATVQVTDTLNYFLNKQQFKIGNVMDKTYPYYKAPTSAAANSYTYVTHLGSIFRNKDASLMVNGLEGWAAKNVRNSSGSSAIPVMLYLCNLNPTTDMPILPAVDSVLTYVNNTCGTDGLCPPQLCAGDFTTKVAG